MSTPQDDPLTAELRGLLPGLFDTAWAELSQVQPRMTAWLRDTVRAEVDTHADAWLRATSTQIARLREARALQPAMSVAYDDGSGYEAELSPYGSYLARALTGALPAALALGMVFLWDWLSGMSVLWTVVGYCVAALLVLAGVWIVNDVLHDTLDGLMVLLVVLIAVITGYGVLMWRYSPTTFWAWVGWLSVGLVILAATVWLMTPFADNGDLEEFGLVSLWAALTVGTALVIPDLRLGLPVAGLLVVVALPLLGYARWKRRQPPDVPAEPQPPRSTEQELSRVRQARTEAAAMLESWKEAILQTAIGPHVRRRIGETLEPPFNQPLAIPIAPGLGQLRAGDFLIATDHFTGIRDSVRLMTGGALGVAGPRGVGKSTLMEAYQIGALAEAPRDQIVVLESVPVRYEAREFALHLYARLCEEIMSFAERRGAHRLSSAPPPPSRAWAWLMRGSVALATAVLLYVTWVLGVTAMNKQDLPAWLPPAGYPVVVLLAAVVAAGLATFRLRRRPAPIQRPVVEAAQVDGLQGLRALAEQRLRRIRFQQHFTEGWSGKLALPGGPELSRTETTQWAEQAMTYPDVIHDFRKFLGTAVRVLSRMESMDSPPVAILIDELDKISTPGKASEFINEIKALFSPSVEGCLFVVAVSEDALASFQRRGLPVRDEFDSAFDTIVRVNYLSRADSFGILRSRVLGLGTEHCSLIYCLAGGLPRDLIRVTRSIAHRQGADLPSLARALVAEDVRDKADALRTVIVQRSQPEPHAGDLIHRLDRLAGTPEESLAAGIRTALLAPPAPSGSAEFDSLCLETLCHLYFSLTLLEVFSSTLTEERLKAGTAGFDDLARAKQLFAVNSRASWLTISAFRLTWGLPEIAMPGSP
ncbi:hypothetical protein ACIBG8_19265 [Nonomuraea sp. NPDC050556]|uniref:hypothetical protein n=1 Tax=Nonomuraea sp. NPDC050556 TaxID=3364369 RepID=UPI0037B62E34